MARSQIDLNGVWNSSPFQANILLDYYDGPVECISRIGSATVHARMIAWDEEQEIRCFQIAQLEDDAFDRVESFFRTLFTPQYPDWIIPGKFSSHTLEVAARALVDDVMSSKGRPLWIGRGPGISKCLQLRETDDEILTILEEQSARFDYDSIERWKHYF